MWVYRFNRRVSMSQPNAENLPQSNASEPQATPRKLAPGGGLPPGAIRKNARSTARPSRRWWLEKKGVWTALLLVALLLTVYLYFERNVWSQNRPLDWRPFSTEEVDYKIRSDHLVVLLVDAPAENGSLGWRKRLDVASVRVEAHRMRTAFYFLSANSTQSENQENIGWIRSCLNSDPAEGEQLPRPPFVIVSHKKWKQSVLLSESTDIAAELANKLKSIRTSSGTD